MADDGSKQDATWPVPKFYFSVQLGSQDNTVSFQEVSGISMEMDTEEITEGGNNSFKHRIPTSVKHSNLILKRGMVPNNSELAAWCMDALSGNLTNQIEPKTIIISLLNENGLPVMVWKFVNAWPVKWAVADLNSMNNEMLIESLEFAYGYFEVAGV